MVEKQVERRLIETVKQSGGMCLKLVGYRGIPDRLLLTEGGRVVFVEVKRPGCKLRPEQEAWQGKLRKMGFDALTIDSYDAVDRMKLFLTGSK